MADGAESIRDRIIAQTSAIGGGPWTTANVFAGPLRAWTTTIPRKAIFVTPQGGPPPWMRMGSGGNVRRQEFTIYVRGDVGAFEANRDVADGVWTAVHRCTLSGFINCVLVTEPLVLTVMPTDQPLISMRVQLWLDA
jgi:hypothetical protein